MHNPYATNNANELPANTIDVEATSELEFLPEYGIAQPGITERLDVPENTTVIGLILSNGIPRHDKYKCHILNCAGVKTFSRLADLKRHNASKHNRQGARFWCPVDGCERSMKCGGRAFPRKDKMFDHLERVHADKVGAASE